MHVLLSLTLLLGFSFGAHAFEDSGLRDLFKKYDLITGAHRVDLMDEVFSENFIQRQGGMAEYVKKIKSEPKDAQRVTRDMTVVGWNKSPDGQLAFARRKPASDKSTAEENLPQWVIIKEDGKLKIHDFIIPGH